MSETSGQKLADLTKRSVAITFSVCKQLFDEGRNALKERSDAKRLQVYKTAIESLKSYEEFLNPETLLTIASFESQCNSDPKSLESFAKSPQIQSLIESCKRREQFANNDVARQLPTHSFVTDCDDFFTGLGYDHVDPILNRIAKQYKQSDIHNVISAGISGYRSNWGGVAQSYAGTAQTASHNAAATSAFTNHMKYVVFKRPAAELDELHRGYIVGAKRLHFFGVGDRKIVARATFSLVFDNGNAVPVLPSVTNKFGPCLVPEFVSNFQGEIWTVKQAAAMLDQIRRTSSVAQELFEVRDIRSILTRIQDKLPPLPGNNLIRT